MRSIREFSNSPIEQGADELCAYRIDTVTWPGAGDPGTVSVVLKELPALTDVSSTKLQGPPSVSGNVITTPVVKLLVAGTQYRLEVKWIKEGNTFEAYGILDGRL